MPLTTQNEIHKSLLEPYQLLHLHKSNSRWKGRRGEINSVHSVSESNRRPYLHCA